LFLFFSDQLIEIFSAFNAFTYITTRGILSALTALVISFVFGPRLINLLEGNDIGESIRDDGPTTHSKKKGTPTMGGILILLSVSVSTLIWSDLTNSYILTIFFSMLLFGLIGFIDDYIKLKGNKNGLSASLKFLMQIGVAYGAVNYLFYGSIEPIATDLLIPFTNNIRLDLGWVFLPFAIFVIVGSSNAVNLTDGLDGLAIMPVVMISIALGIFAYVTGNINFSSYLDLPFLREAGEVFVICCAISGAGLGFLWFNTYPAQVFMGDVGAISLGGTLGLISVIVKQELVLAIMGGVFIVETLSVILQVGSYKIRGKRIFNMAPIHHHFELKGWAEPKVIVRFWIITVFLVLIGLSSLKIR
jgi:phospho-N-acetylmuramoyl-pentapeptide-transferase